MRFSIRTFLLCVALLVIPLGIWIGRADSQRKTVVEIQKLGGTVCFDDEFMIMGKVGIPRTGTDSLMRNLRHSVTAIGLTNHIYDDELKSKLAKLPRLRQIDVRGRESDLGTARITNDFPSINVTDINELWDRVIQ